MNNFENCCGCGACALICPAHAITMKPDKIGFLYPNVDESACIHCNRCNNICPATPATPEHQQYFAGRCKDETELMRSQSGGAFYAISQEALRRGFAVYGAAFDEQFHVKHIRATTEEERDCMRGSKYVQSNISGVYKDIISDLKNNRPVLFSGNPCQVAAVKSVVGKTLGRNLYTVDLFCHAVTSPGIWHDNLEQIRHGYKADIVAARFRDKRLLSPIYWETYELSNGKKLRRMTSNYLFVNHLSIRESCLNCPFSTLSRGGDISIGDFHSHANYSKKYTDLKGVSSVIINTAKGEEFLAALHTYMNLEPITKEMILQPQLQSPISDNPIRKNFCRDYAAKGFTYVARKYGDQGFRYKCIMVRNKFHGLFKKIKKLFKR